MDSKNIEENFILHLFFSGRGNGAFREFYFEQMSENISHSGNRSSRPKFISPEVMSPKLDSCNLKFLVMSPEI